MAIERARQEKLDFQVRAAKIAALFDESMRNRLNYPIARPKFADAQKQMLDTVGALLNKLVSLGSRKKKVDPDTWPASVKLSPMPIIKTTIWVWDRDGKLSEKDIDIGPGQLESPRVFIEALEALYYGDDNSRADNQALPEE